MRKYLIYYWAEKNDDAVDCEKIIEASNIQEALNKFLNMTIVYKRITQIKEI
jgi:hypothetical protein